MLEIVLGTRTYRSPARKLTHLGKIDIAFYTTNRPAIGAFCYRKCFISVSIRKIFLLRYLSIRYHIIVVDVLGGKII